MKLTAKKKVNGAVLEFEFEGKDMKELMLQAQPLLEDDNCWLDGFKDSFVKWEVQRNKSKKDGKMYTYVKKIARTPEGRTASRTLGTYQDDSGHFWNAWEEYTPKDKAETKDDITVDGEPF